VIRWRRTGGLLKGKSKKKSAAQSFEDFTITRREAFGSCAQHKNKTDKGGKKISVLHKVMPEIPVRHHG